MVGDSIAIISPDTLSLDEAYQSILNPECGGICFFIGTVRNKNKGESVTHLDFETYDAMAIKEMHKIIDQAFTQFDIRRMCIYHRSGHVGISDIAVIIGVSSVHRATAFQACQYGIDTLKKTVPIWKKEHLESGGYWVGSRP